MSDTEDHSPGIFATTAVAQGGGVGAKTWGLCPNALDRLGFPNADGCTSIISFATVRVCKTLKRTSLAVISIVQRLNLEI